MLQCWRQLLIPNSPQVSKQSGASPLLWTLSSISQAGVCWCYHVRSLFQHSQFSFCLLVPVNASFQFRLWEQQPRCSFPTRLAVSVSLLPKNTKLRPRVWESQMGMIYRVLSTTSTSRQTAAQWAFLSATSTPHPSPLIPAAVTSSGQRSVFVNTPHGHFQLLLYSEASCWWGFLHLRSNAAGMTAGGLASVYSCINQQSNDTHTHLRLGLE